MRRYLTAVLGLTALAGAAAYAGQARPVPQAMPQPRMPVPVSAILPQTQALYDGYVRDRRLAGIVGAFGYGDRPTFYVTAGRIALDPAAAAADPDSLWRVYSMTKPVTAFAAMILIDEGKLGLDDPVAKYIPAFARMRVATDPQRSLQGWPAATPITVRHLLTHTAGFGYGIMAKGALLKEYERLGLTPYVLNPAVETAMRRNRPRTLAEFANRVAATPLIAEPGTKWSYSMSLDVTARVVEVASGLSFERFTQTRIFDPLGMRSTYWTVPAGDVRRFATNYTMIGGRLVPLDAARTSPFLRPPSFPYGGAGLVSSARDYDRFLHMLQDDGSLGGVRLVKPATVALMTSNLLPAGVKFDGDPTAKIPVGFGAGGYVTLADVPGGPRKGTYGWSGAASTQAWVDRAGRSRGTIMLNIFPYDAVPVRDDTLRTLAADLRRFG